MLITVDDEDDYDEAFRFRVTRSESSESLDEELLFELLSLSESDDADEESDCLSFELLTFLLLRPDPFLT